MLWLEDEDGNAALPSLWDANDDQESLEDRSKKVASFANDLIHGSLKKAACKDHGETDDVCQHCQEVYRTVSRYQCHSHKKSCFKKKRMLTILGNEGHGRLDGKKTDVGMTVPE